jgi:hypothetical protein
VKNALLALSIVVIVIVVAAFVLLRKPTEQAPPPSGPPTQNFGAVMGSVYDVEGGAVGSVTVSVADRTATANVDGWFTIDSVPVSDRVLVTFSKNGYIPVQKAVKVVSGDNTYLYVMMKQAGPAQPLNAASGGTVARDNGSITIEPNSLVDSAGNSFTGTAEVSLTVFDPSNENHRVAFPGNFAGLEENVETGENVEVPFESFGFMNVSVTEPDGDPLQLALGKTATVEIPIPSDGVDRAPQNIDLWYYDENEGYWRKEGTAAKSEGVYRGVTSHFSYWNADRKFRIHTPTCIVAVRGSPIRPVANATLVCDGVDYWGRTEATSGLDGRVRVAARANSTVRIWATWRGKSSRVQIVNTGPPGGETDLGTIVIGEEVTQAIAMTFGTNVWVNDELGHENSGYAPSVAVDGAGNIYVAWEGYRDNVYPEIFLSKSSDGGITFPTNTPITMQTAAWVEEPSIAVDGNVHVVYLWTNDYHIYYQKSTDKGSTFSSRVRVSDQPASSSAKPEIAVYGGNIYVVWAGGDDNIYIDKSTDGGATFGTDVRVNPVGGIHRMPSIAVGGDIYVSWNNASETGIYCAKSIDSGASFALPVRVASLFVEPKEPSIAASGDNIYIVWWDVDQQDVTKSNIWFTKSTDGGTLFEANVKVGSAGTFPDQSITSHNNKIFVTWSHENVYLIASGDGGVSFGENIKVSDASPRPDYEHGRPSIAVKGENIYVAWQDARYNGWNIFFCKGSWGLTG